MICRKCSVADVWRDEETHKALLSDSKPAGVAWIGAPGISKSIGMGFQLADLLQDYRHINVRGNVFLRSPKSAYKVSFSRRENGGNENVTVEQLCEENTLGQFKLILKKNLLKKNVLLLELGEQEVDPGFRIPTLRTTSANDAEEILKVPLKTAGFLLYLVQPWLKEEFRLLVALFLVVAPRSKVEFGDDVFSDNAEKENFWQYRYEKVGGIP